MTTDYAEVLRQIQADSRYQQNIQYGKPRPGHPEGAVSAHIAQLEQNLDQLSPRLTDEEQARLRVLIHVHDTFKAEAKEGVPITHPQSHASLAQAFLAEFCEEPELLEMVQRHDEPFALWRQLQYRGSFREERLEQLLAAIADWKLYTAFLLIDGCTTGKDRAWIRWFFELIGERVESQFVRDPAPLLS